MNFVILKKNTNPFCKNTRLKIPFQFPCFIFSALPTSTNELTFNLYCYFICHLLLYGVVIAALHVAFVATINENKCYCHYLVVYLYKCPDILLNKKQNLSFFFARRPKFFFVPPKIADSRLKIRN